MTPSHCPPSPGTQEQLGNGVGPHVPLPQAWACPPLHDNTFQGDREVDVERVGLAVAEIRQGLGVL